MSAGEITEVVICPDTRRALYEAEHEAARHFGDVLKSDGQVKHADGSVTWYLSVRRAYVQLRGLRLQSVRWIERHRMALYERAPVAEIARTCMRP